MTEEERAALKSAVVFAIDEAFDLGQDYTGPNYSSYSAACAEAFRLIEAAA